MPGAFKLYHLQPIKPLLFPNLCTFFTFILGGQFLLPQRANYQKSAFIQPQNWMRLKDTSACDQWHHFKPLWCWKSLTRWRWKAVRIRAMRTIFFCTRMKISRIFLPLLEHAVLTCMDGWMEALRLQTTPPPTTEAASRERPESTLFVSQRVVS